MYALFELIPIFVMLGLLGGLGWILRAKYSEAKWLKRLIEQRTTYALLICWTLFGFITNLDYTQNWGCMSSTEQIFTTENMLYSLTALSLLSIGFFMPSRSIGTVILTFELIFWLYKLTLVKGGYVVGFGGVPSISVLAFDCVALILRLILIKQVYQLRFKTFFVLILALIIMTLKVQFFR